MSRHSKNNTAGSVFTYGERQKLKNLNEWGQVNARIGRDSQKKFEQCSLCLKCLEEPMCCPKGHIFCQECILENLLMQKKEIKKKIQVWSENQNILHLEEDKKIQKEKEIKAEILKNMEDGVAQVETEYNIENFLPDEAQKQIKIIEEVLESKKAINLKERGENIENCFWIPEKTPNFKNDKISKPSEALYCPTKEKDHIIKVKNLLSLKITKQDDKFSCSVCHRELTVQKIVALKTCGHVMCKKCLQIIDKCCTICNKEFLENDVINLQESGTGYSTHNQVITNKLNPFFKC